MRHLTFSDTAYHSYPVCLLVPVIRKDDIQKIYLDNYGISPDHVMVLELHRSKDKKKTPKAEMVQYVKDELEPVIKELNVEYILCGDSEYFKVLAKTDKVDANLGYVLDSIIGPKVIYVPNYQAVFYDPEKVNAKIAQGMDALYAHVNGTYQDPGTNIIQFGAYPKTVTEISDWLDKLIEMDVPLAIDIEAFSLKHTTSGIGTICFAWSKTEGIAFAVDYEEIPGATEAPFGRQVKNEPVRDLLRLFFIRLVQKAYYHSISYDVYILIYQLFMKDILDTEGLLYGMETMLRNWDDTKLITYLATNSCSGNKLSLKDQAQEYSGNYAQTEIKDITRIKLPDLLRYNLVDGISTWYVKEKHWDTMVADNQLDIYENVFKPSILDIVQMQLTGLPINMKRVKEVKGILEKDSNDALTALNNNPIIQQFTHNLNEQWVNKKNSEYKKKRVTLADAKEVFNPNSNPQMQALLYDQLGLPILNYTDSKQPSCDGETLEALLNHTTDPLILDMLNNLMSFSIVGTLLSNFIPSFENAALGPDGWHYLFGNFNLGGTLSGRLSSSDPNLQNLPSTGKGNPRKTKYAKLMKSCIQAPPGWLFAGIDFASLEDRISALTTKDPNKLKVYTDGYDGHSLRAYAYFGDQMTGIIDTVESINSIQKLYKPLRDRSKNPTFTLTYQGTYIALVKKYGFTEVQAKDVEAKYHALYKVSDDWVNAKLDQAMKDGYITAAFGLRVRTPLLAQVIRGTSKTPYEAEAEGRTAGNALGQSWCLLNNRAGIEFNAKVRNSQFRLDIRPCAQIHDAQYHLIREDMSVILYCNEHLVEAVKWQNDPEIWHPDVKLGGEFSIFYPDWSKELTIPNGASEQQIHELIASHVEKL